MFARLGDALILVVRSGDDHPRRRPAGEVAVRRGRHAGARHHPELLEPQDAWLLVLQVLLRRLLALLRERDGDGEAAATATGTAAMGSRTTASSAIRAAACQRRRSGREPPASRPWSDSSRSRGRRPSSMPTLTAAIETGERGFSSTTDSRQPGAPRDPLGGTAARRAERDGPPACRQPCPIGSRNPCRHDRRQRTGKARGPARRAGDAGWRHLLVLPAPDAFLHLLLAAERLVGEATWRTSTSCTFTRCSRLRRCPLRTGRRGAACRTSCGRWGR